MIHPGLTFHLIPHTHWDREWYLPRGQLTARLVEMIDDLIDLLGKDPAIPGFLLDGQTVLLEDYLRVRPEQETAVRALVSAGRIETGPWYVLSDEQIPSAESLIRNLLLGSADAARWGRRMNVLYSPDAFGHPGILPLLAVEFGITYGVAWRGLSGRSGDLVRWRGPDGRAILLYHLPPEGYEVGSGLSSDPAHTADTWLPIRRLLAARARSREIAVMVGADHHSARTDLISLRDAIRGVETANEVRLSRLEDYCDAIASTPDLAMLDGEQRFHGYTWALQDVHSTRLHQKRRNSRLELLLERFAEPLSALNLLRGGRDRRPLLRSAWRDLVQCHFHDAIGGCCSDAVALELDTRFATVEGTAKEIIRGSLDNLTGHDPDRARDAPESVVPSMVCWNPAARRRGGVVFTQVTMFRKDILVGPPGNRTPRTGEGFRAFSLESPAGEVIPVQVLDVMPGLERLDARVHYPDQDEVDVARIAFRAPMIAGLGTMVLRTRDAEPAGEVSAQKRNRKIANELVEVELERDGTLILTNRLSGRSYPGLLAIEYEGDQGDTYTFCPRAGAEPPLKSSRVRVSRVVRGPIFSMLEASWSLSAGADRRRAADGRVEIRLRMVLAQGEAVVRCTLVLVNRGVNQRIRARLPTGVAGLSSLAGGQLSTVVRAAPGAHAAAVPIERPVDTAPAHRFVSAADTHGIGLFAPGFFEYELTPAGDLFFTLLRSVGQLSKNDLITRPGHAGWPTPTPLAQCPGTHEIVFAIAPLAGRICRDGAGLHRLWENTFLPVRATWLRDFSPSAGLPDPGSTIELEGDGLVVSAIKPADEGGGVVLRCFSLRDEPVEAVWRFGFRVTRAVLCRADETELDGLTLEDDGRSVRSPVAPRSVLTVKVS